MAVIIDDAHPEVSDKEFTQEVLSSRRRGIKKSNIEVEGVDIDYDTFHDWSQGRNLPDQATRRKVMPVLKEINRSL